MHCRGWSPGGLCTVHQRELLSEDQLAPINLSDRLHQVLRLPLGSVEIFLSLHCPVEWRQHRRTVGATSSYGSSVASQRICSRSSKKVLAVVDTNFMVTSKAGEDAEFGELYMFKWTTILIVLNIVGVVAGISDAINNGYGSWGPSSENCSSHFGLSFISTHFLRGLMGRQNRLRLVILWLILVASISSLIWVRIDPFLPKQTGPILKQCGVDC